MYNSRNGCDSVSQCKGIRARTMPMECEWAMMHPCVGRSLDLSSNTSLAFFMAHRDTYSNTPSASPIGSIASMPTGLCSAGSPLRRLMEDTSWMGWHERSCSQAASGGKGCTTELASTCSSRAKYTVTTLHLRGRKGFRAKDIIPDRTRWASQRNRRSKTGLLSRCCEGSCCTSFCDRVSVGRRF